MDISYLDILLRLALATVAGGIIGYERETRRHPAGLRTHILVCVGAATVATIECLLIDRMSGMENGNVSITLGRMSAQVVSGIGFLGAGTIITTKRNIAGLTTAATLWGIACIGIAAGMGLYALTGIATGFTLLVLTVIKRIVVGHIYKLVEISFQHRVETLEFLNGYMTEHHIRVVSVDFRVEANAEGNNIYTNVYTLDLPRKFDSAAMVTDIAEYHNVTKVRTRDP